MIGYLKGTIILAKDNQVIVLANSIGWTVHTGSRLFTEGKEVELFIHTQVRENDISLWGVENARELALFKKLLQVSGIGGRTAITLITEKGVDHIVQAISFMEAKSLQVSGIGKKTAEKIVLELKDKISEIGQVNVSSGKSSRSLPEGVLQFTLEATEALENLGYRRVDIDIALTDLREDEVVIGSSEQLIKELLKRL